MTSWQRVLLGDIATVNEVSRTKDWPYVHLRYIDISSVGEGFLEREPLRLNLKEAPSRAQRIVRTGDTVVSSVRPNRRSMFYASNPGNDWVVSTGFSVITPSSRIDPRFLYMTVFSKNFTEYLISREKGAAYPAVTADDIRNAPILLPPIGEQRAIASMFGALEDRIENNSKINHHLEQIAQALFKSWFVDFEPWGGQMPSNWKKRKLPEIAEMVGGYSYRSSELAVSSTAMATIKNFSRGGGFRVEGFKEIRPASQVKASQFVDLFETIVAHTDLTQNAEIIGNAEMLLTKGKYEQVLASTDLVKVTPAASGMTKILLGTLLRSPDFKRHCLGYVNGTTVLHLSKNALREYSFYCPEDFTELSRISSLFSAIYTLMSVNIEESEVLKNNRDMLLPPLMSGELSIADLNN